MPISDPIINRTISEVVRPTAERARGLLIEAQAHAPRLAAIVASLEGVDDAEVLDDGREREGVRPLTVGQFRACVSMLGELTVSIGQDARLPSVLGACVQHIRVS